MSNSIIYYPGYSQVQVEQNLLVQTIQSITQANPALVTTVKTHGYPAGCRVTFLISSSFGMVQLNNISAYVLAVTDTTLTIDINTLYFTAFAYPSPLPGAYTPPSIIPQASGSPLPPLPLPYGNQDTFEGAIFNNGAIGDPIS